MPITRLDTPICSGDLLRTGATSRAALYVQSETIVRVDQHTTIALAQTVDETVIEFFEDQSARPTSSNSCGAGYFISRFPKKLSVKSPYLNAAIEGTEFQMALQCATTELAVIEGAVRARTVSSGEERLLTKGESWAAGPSTPSVFKTLIKPTDAVQWVLYYPPLSEANAVGDIPAVAQCRGLQAPADQACLTHRAEVLLRRGQISDAQRAIDETLSLNPANADANALRAIIEIAANNVVEAREIATAATASAPNEYRTWLALSYAQQAAFDLNAALESAQKAQALQPALALTNARVAELLLSLGRFNEAERSAQKAVDANPNEPLGHSMLGFVHLAQINTAAARKDFDAAIACDSFEPLPRLGLGLAIIREGQLVAGREQLEIAVALDPSNSLLRSYVGKAYYEENTKARDALAANQFGLAKQLDPKDPTPWFYGAILQLSQNRPVESLESLNTSIEKNGYRAVYRSELRIDQDHAARAADTAAVYGDLGFERLAILASTKAIDEDPSNSSAHELLATSIRTFLGMTSLASARLCRPRLDNLYLFPRCPAVEHLTLSRFSGIQDLLDPV